MPLFYKLFQKIDKGRNNSQLIYETRYTKISKLDKDIKKKPTQNYTAIYLMIIDAKIIKRITVN